VILSSENLLRLALIREYEEALKWKQTYESMANEFAGLLREIVRYCEENNINISNDERLRRTLLHARAVVLKEQSDESYHRDDFRDSDGKLPEPPFG
jgi:hypothetical protein